jgi:CheY-like chemotaxis protein
MDPLKVLIVDDNLAHGTGLAELLGLNGFITFHAATGTEGLELATTHSIDAVLLDIDLPDMTGREVCRLLRADERTANVAIVFHTGSERAYQQEHQGDSFLTYPVNYRELIAVIEGCVARRRTTSR